ncbi:MAG TPA: hypothetical protein VH024_14880, partial [Candidatus Angelobacter sp.]|nr:hypothetical protein [Candidatus Angelobacter sp.]
EAPGNGLKAEYLQKSAMTYLREQKYDDADKAYRQAAESAHGMGQWVWEARAYRIMAMYQTDHDTAAKELEQAEAVLAGNKDAVAQADLDEEQARILRVRVEHAVARKDHATAQRLLAELQKMASSGSISIQRTYSGAAGTLLLAQKKYREAAAQLEQDFMNPVSIRLLITAEQKANAKAAAEEWRVKLLDWKIPTVEEALTVPLFRTQQGIAAKK